jgi:uroporphyrinogen decarboxylase
MDFLDIFAGKLPTTPPFWFMRQAGRYLPEYRALREKSGGFLLMCYTPEIATEITMQPIRRFGMSAAIIFSDILVVPHGLGLKLEFLAGEGPNLQTIINANQVANLSIEAMMEHLQPVYAAITQTRAELDSYKALIGFAGAPWTLLCYMLDGNGRGDFMQARTAIYSSPEICHAIIALLIEAISEHLSAQIEAGANAVQLFDSWAAHVPVHLREQLIYAPTKAIVERVRSRHPHAPIICFPRGIGEADLLRFAEIVQPDGISVDQFTNLALVAEKISPNITLQGNVDNLALAYNGAEAVRQVASLKQAMQGRRFVLNLGHGVIPQTPLENMQAIIDEIRG